MRHIVSSDPWLPPGREHTIRASALKTVSLFMGVLLLLLTTVVHLAHTCSVYTSAASDLRGLPLESGTTFVFQDRPFGDEPCLACLFLEAMHSTQASALDHFFGCFATCEALPSHQSDFLPPKIVFPAFSPRAPPLGSTLKSRTSIS